jgi:chemotaxis protein MotB
METETVPRNRIKRMRRQALFGWLAALLVAGGTAGILMMAMEKGRIHAAVVEELADENHELLRQASANKAALKSATGARDALLREKQIASEGSPEDKALFSQLEKEISRKDARVYGNGREIIIRVPNRELFPTDAADLSLSGMRILGRLGETLKAIPDRAFVVAGHTGLKAPSKRSKFESNWDLSAARAVAVTRYLNEQAAIPAERLAATAHAGSQPYAKSAGRNRRLEIIIKPDPEAAAPGASSD